MAVIFVTAMIVLPFWEWVSRHWNKRLAYAAGSPSGPVVQIVLIYLEPWHHPGGDYGPVHTGRDWVSAAHVLPWSLSGRHRWDEWQTASDTRGCSTAWSRSLRRCFFDRHPADSPDLQVTAMSRPPLLSRIAPCWAFAWHRSDPGAVLCGGIVFASLPTGAREHRRIVQELEARRSGPKKEEDERRNRAAGSHPQERQIF